MKPLGACLFVVFTVVTSLAQGVAEGEDDRGAYRIGIEDVLLISVWGEEELSISVKVRPDGKISLPLVSDVAVVGRSPQSVRDEIGQRLKDYVRDPNVTVIVEEINSFKVYVLGEVNNQGVLNFYRPTRMLQALAAAGGLSKFAKKEVTLIREIDGVETRSKVNYKKLIAGDGTQENIFVRPGDTVLVE